MEEWLTLIYQQQAALAPHCTLCTHRSQAHLPDENMSAELLMEYGIFSGGGTAIDANRRETNKKTLHEFTLINILRGEAAPSHTQ